MVVELAGSTEPVDRAHLGRAVPSLERAVPSLEHLAQHGQSHRVAECRDVVGEVVPLVLDRLPDVGTLLPCITGAPPGNSTAPNR